MESYKPQEIEKKWQKIWEETKPNKAVDFDSKPKKYVLDMFPYPSGAGLHVGHIESYTATDIYSRFLRMNGYNVLHPMGWDAFGLPAENYAIKTGTHPKTTTEKNIAIFREQLKSMGFSYDWEREIDTTDPEYYKWTQWIFLKLFEHGLAYEDTAPINFCPSCKTGLANEEVENGVCERCKTPVTRKSIRQWILKITKYADRLLNDLDKLDWPESIKEMQRNWIGKSNGAEIKFRIMNNESRIKAFTTRPDTLFGATYMVVAPESILISKIKNKILNIEEVNKYINKALNKTDLERTDLAKEKTGIEIKGIKAINPATKEEIPIFIADYVLGHYGTGAIMAVPAHDERDFEFARKYNLPIKQVVLSPDLNGNAKDLKEAYIGEGVNINSDFLNDLPTKDAKKKIIEWLEKEKVGEGTTTYKLRDWIFSRQRYWGEPIPIIHCEKCGIVPVPEKDLPIVLPNVKKYEPSGNGESPLVSITDWVNTTCPKCRRPAKRETNTMPQWAGSCWYYIAFAQNQKSKINGFDYAHHCPEQSRMDKNQKVGNVFIDNEDTLKYWLPIDMYVGGAEHAVLHLLYARFWHKFLFDIKVVSTNEPFATLKNQGMILAEDGRKMSKSFENVVNPEEVINKYGADVLRLYEMFLGPFEMVKHWDTKSIEGVYRFLKKVHRLASSGNFSSAAEEVLLHQTIKKVTDDIQNFRFNTAISALMILTNQLTAKTPSKKEVETLIVLLSPFAPHLTEELWQRIGNDKSIFSVPWPKYDTNKINKSEIEMVIQINSKTRAKIQVQADLPDDKVRKVALENERIKGLIGNKEIKKVIVVKNRLINFVI